MIKANELRTGNLVMWDNKTIYTISGISKQGLRFENDHYQFRSVDRVWPIPLTPEILEKAGFENHDSDVWFKDGIYIICYEEGCIYLANQKHVHLFYLHQLQNLYFALTGEELNINL